MSQMNVEQFASELGVLPTVLLEQLQAAGVRKHMTEDSLTEKDKTQLLEYLRKIHGAKEEKGKISLPRRQTSEIKKADSTGKPRSIQVEVRKKRVFVKGDLTAERKTAETAAPSAPSVPPVRTPVIDAAQQALRQEEARRQAELIARQAAELREKRLRERPPV
ncbi:MAG TPA: translation initiation factor IF-2 associated domain-containing protein, partial [Nitrosospira sp.]|nr:translation initiation factor IF-2 associated domain-containing protein [Nitrosospira sp.]